MTAPSDSFHNLTFTLTNTAAAQDREYIHQQIKAFNNIVSEHHRAVRKTGLQQLDIFVRDETGKLVGGLTADTYWDWLEIDNLWLDESLRKRGLGTRLIAIVETEARKRGCKHVHLRTFSFQARGFYEKRGYRVVGALEDYPPGQTFYWMCKDFA